MAKKIWSVQSRHLRAKQREQINAVRSRYMRARSQGMSMEEAADFAYGRTGPQQTVNQEPDTVDDKPVDAYLPAGSDYRAYSADEYNAASQVEPQDDLTEIGGIGSTTARKLHQLGITSFKQIAEWDEETARSFDERLDLKGRVLRNDWVGQAKALMD